MGTLGFWNIPDVIVHAQQLAVSGLKRAEADGQFRLLKLYRECNSFSPLVHSLDGLIVDRWTCDQKLLSSNLLSDGKSSKREWEMFSLSATEAVAKQSQMSKTYNIEVGSWTFFCTFYIFSTYSFKGNIWCSSIFIFLSTYWKGDHFQCIHVPCLDQHTFVLLSTQHTVCQRTRYLVSVCFIINAIGVERGVWWMCDTPNWDAVPRTKKKSAIQFLMYGCSGASAAVVLKLITALTLCEHHSLLFWLLWSFFGFHLLCSSSFFFFYLLQEVCVLVRRLTLSCVSQFRSMNRAPGGSLQPHL